MNIVFRLIFILIFSCGKKSITDNYRESVYKFKNTDAINISYFNKLDFNIPLKGLGSSSKNYLLKSYDKKFIPARLLRKKLIRLTYKDIKGKRVYQSEKIKNFDEYTWIFDDKYYKNLYSVEELLSIDDSYKLIDNKSTVSFLLSINNNNNNNKELLSNIRLNILSISQADMTSTLISTGYLKSYDGERAFLPFFRDDFMFNYQANYIPNEVMIPIINRKSLFALNIRDFIINNNESFNKKYLEKSSKFSKIIISTENEDLVYFANSYITLSQFLKSIDKDAIITNSGTVKRFKNKETYVHLPYGFEMDKFHKNFWYVLNKEDMFSPILPGKTYALVYSNFNSLNQTFYEWYSSVSVDDLIDSLKIGRFNRGEIIEIIIEGNKYKPIFSNILKDIDAYSDEELCFESPISGSDICRKKKVRVRCTIKEKIFVKYDISPLVSNNMFKGNGLVLSVNGMDYKFEKDVEGVTIKYINDDNKMIYRLDTNSISTDTNIFDIEIKLKPDKNPVYEKLGFKGWENCIGDRPINYSIAPYKKNKNSFEKYKVSTYVWGKILK